MFNDYFLSIDTLNMQRLFPKAILSDSSDACQRKVELISKAQRNYDLKGKETRRGLRQALRNRHCFT